MDGVAKQIHICKVCALEKGLDFLFSPEKEEGGFVCNVCGLTWEEFEANWRLGCTACYNVFGDKLRRVLEDIHKSTRHVGKSPEKDREVFELKKRLEELKRRLSVAVDEERFDRAAKLRDEIRMLEEEIAKRRERRAKNV